MKGANQKSGLPSGTGSFRLTGPGRVLNTKIASNKSNGALSQNLQLLCWKERSFALKNSKSSSKNALFSSCLPSYSQWRKARATKQTNQRRVLAHVVLGQTRRNTSFFRQTIYRPRNTFVQSRDALHFSFFAYLCRRSNIAQLIEVDKGKQVSAFAVEIVSVFTKWKIPGRCTEEETRGFMPKYKIQYLNLKKCTIFDQLCI